MSKRPKALIIGGGIAGPVTAIFLKRAGIDAEIESGTPNLEDVFVASTGRQATATGRAA